MCDVTECSQTSCPFAGTEESETVHNYACLPTPHEIISMKIKCGKTWACHSDPTKPCIGAIKFFEEKGLIAKVSDPVMVTVDDKWNLYT